MPAIHGDPLVMNANTGKWQNASAPDPLTGDVVPLNTSAMGPIYGVDPVAGEGPANWVTFSSLGYQNSFTDTSTPVTEFVPQFRFIPLGRTVQWRGVVRTPPSGGNPNNLTIIQVPPAYTVDGLGTFGLPGARWPVLQISPSGVGVPGGWAFLDSTGILTVHGCATGSNLQNIDLTGLCFLS